MFGCARILCKWIGRSIAASLVGKQRTMGEVAHLKGERCKVPMIIHQTWKTAEIPAHWQASIDSIKKHMPDWELRLTTDEDNRAFVAEHYPWFLSTYDALPYPIMRADAVRYCLLHKYGGLYLDLDIELTGSLEGLFIDGELFLAQSGNCSVYLTNSIMASVSGHEFWIGLLKEMIKGPPVWSTLLKHLHVMAGSGPYLVDQVAKSGEYSYVLLPPELVSAYSLCDDGRVDKGAYTRPLSGGSSWASIDTLVLNTVYCQWPVLVLLGLALLMLLIWCYAFG